MRISTRHLMILMMSFCLLIGNGCFLQPVTLIEKKFSIIDYKNMPALLLLEPVQAHVARKNLETGEWEDIGWGELCAFGLFKGSKPDPDPVDILKEENDGQ